MNQGEGALRAALLVCPAVLEPGARVQIREATFNWQTDLIGLTGTVVKLVGDLVYVDLREANRGILNGFRAEHLALRGPQ